MHCTGPCQQGDKPCPCPMACEQADDEISLSNILLRFVVGVLAFIGLGAIVGYFDWLDLTDAVRKVMLLMEVKQP